MIVNISNCPISNLKRKAEMLKFSWDRRNKKIQMDCEINYFENNSGEYGDQIFNDRFRPYTVFIEANNFYYMNPNTGDIIPVEQYNLEQHVDFVLEYNYWEPFAYNETIIADVLEQQIMLADQREKFN